MNENENATTQNLWDTAKAVLRGRFIAIQAYLKKQEKSQINNLTLHLKQLDKEEMKNLRVSRRKEILKIRAEINAKETKETIAKINRAKSWFFEKENKIHKPLARLVKKQREKNQVSKIRNENGEITTDNTEIQRIIKAMVFPVVMYRCESWIINKTESQRIVAFQLWCCSRLLRIPWTARRSNQSILKEISP